jgi:hypothetical protein
MRMRARIPAILLALAAAMPASLATPRPAAAQTPRPERPYRGLFAGGPADVAQELTASLSLGGGYGRDRIFGVRDEGDTEDPERSTDQAFNYFSGALNYALNRGAASFRTGASMAGRYYPDLEADPWVTGYNGSIAGSLSLTSRTTFTVDQGIAYQPLQTLDFFPSVYTPVPGAVTPFDPSFSVLTDPLLSFTTSVGIGHEISSRSRLSAGYGRSWSERRSDSETDFTFQNASAQFTQSISRNLGLRLGYGYGRGQSAGDGSQPEFSSHSLDGGLDFNKAISLSRRTHLAFSTGTSALSDGRDTRFNVTGSAQLTREIGRTWNAGLAYQRSAQFVETLRQAVFQDSLAASVGGLVNRRVQFTASMGAAHGEIGVRREEARGYTTLFGSAGLTVGLTRYIGLSTGYSYNRHDIDDISALPAGAIRQLDRHAVQVALQVWAPILQRAQGSRSANASR